MQQLVFVSAGIVRRPVDRVDDPDILVVEILQVFLLAEEAAPGEKFRQSSGQEVLHGHVGGRHDVLQGSFLLHGESVPDHQAGGLPDCFCNLFQCNRFHGFIILRFASDPAEAVGPAFGEEAEIGSGAEGCPPGGPEEGGKADEGKVQGAQE